MGDDACTCYQDWRMGDDVTGDCSDRQCPSEFAWVDTPNENGLVHKYTECAGRGVCDRETGICECFEGYTGKGCQRTTCPNDCSGHGRCMYVEELSYAAVYSDYYGFREGLNELGSAAVTFTDTIMTNYWDAHKTRGCVCDSQWTEVDCSRRMCPKANDVMDERLNVGDTVLYQQQMIRLFSGGADGRGTTPVDPLSTTHSR